ncbi:MAG: hypothetical protein VKL42_12575 [Snowella sp.]|nr:hypothetical protein [Snowella sp.]
MIKKIGKISPDTLEELRELANSMIPLMENDSSNYGKGRKRLWLFNEVNLRTSEITKEYFNDRLFRLAQRFDCNIGLMSYGGKSLESDGLIGWHRDHSYAMATAYTVNLGSAIFGYDLDRDGEIRGNGRRNRQLFQLNDGDIIQFNCKHPHSLIEIQSEIRFGINFWKLNEAKGFKSLI